MVCIICKEQFDNTIVLTKCGQIVHSKCIVDENKCQKEECIKCEKDKQELEAVKDKCKCGEECKCKEECKEKCKCDKECKCGEEEVPQPYLCIQHKYAETKDE